MATARADEVKVILVDIHDQEIGEAEKMTAHRLGLLHRAFSVFVFLKTPEGNQLLLQQRHPDKYHSPNLWTNTCCSHPRPGESVAAAAERRLQEEMGLTLPLKKAGAFCYRAEFKNQLIEHEYDHVFIGFATSPLVPYNKTEVSAIHWTTLPELQQDLHHHPEKFTPWFKQALEIALR